MLSTLAKSKVGTSTQINDIRLEQFFVENEFIHSSEPNLKGRKSHTFVSSHLRGKN